MSAKNLLVDDNKKYLVEIVKSIETINKFLKVEYRRVYSIEPETDSEEFEIPPVVAYVSIADSLFSTKIQVDLENKQILLNWCDDKQQVISEQKVLPISNLKSDSLKVYLIVNTNPLYVEQKNANIITIIIHPNNGGKYKVKVNRDILLSELRKRLVTISGFQPDEQRITYISKETGEWRLLSRNLNDKSLRELEIKDRDIISVAWRFQHN